MPSGWCDLSVRMGLPDAADDLARTVYAKVKSSAPVVAVAGEGVSRVGVVRGKMKALRREAEAEHGSTHQVALAAVGAYVHQATPVPRQPVPVTEPAFAAFQRSSSIPPRSAGAALCDLESNGPIVR